MSKRPNLSELLEDWFAAVKRPMPWRLHPTPYGCWLSEIMMQQTTYATVLPFYERFLNRFPTVVELAGSEESEVLKKWEGLGYYARARNLLKAARQIVTGKRANWPKTLEGWAALPGVGPYTAAALSSVLNNVRSPVVDGNVARVFARVWRLTDDFSKLPAREKLATRLKAEIAKARVPGDFNQAMMELGALVCTPSNPACEKCPLSSRCAARKHDCWADYPVKPLKKALPLRKSQAIVITDNKGRVLLVKNNKGGLLKGLWELPTIVQACSIEQTFSHFKQELDAFQPIRSDLEFCDPKLVPLTTATRKVLRLVVGNVI